MNQRYIHQPSDPQGDSFEVYDNFFKQIALDDNGNLHSGLSLEDARGVAGRMCNTQNLTPYYIVYRLLQYPNKDGEIEGEEVPLSPPLRSGTDVSIFAEKIDPDILWGCTVAEFYGCGDDDNDDCEQCDNLEEFLECLEASLK